MENMLAEYIPASHKNVLSIYHVLLNITLEDRQCSSIDHLTLPHIENIQITCEQN